MKRSAQSHAQSFGAGAALLLLSAVVVKLIGAFYKIPLTNRLGGEGMGYYMTAYSVFNPVYAVSVAGFPAAIARVYARTGRRLDAAQERALLSQALRVFLPVALVFGVLLVLFAGTAAAAVGNPRAWPCIRAIAPAVLFCCLTSVIRGVSEGKGDMRPTALGQCAEAAIKLAAGLALVHLCLLSGESDPVRLACAGLSGVTLSALGGFFAALLLFRRERTPPGASRVAPSYRALRRSLRGTALPVSLAALVTNLTSVVDLVTVMNRLALAVGKNAALVAAAHPGALLDAMPQKEIPNFLFGAYTALAMTAFHLIPALTAPLCTCALPFVSSLFGGGERQKAKTAVSAVLKAAALLAFPAGIGIAVLAKPILLLLFPDSLREVAVASGILRPLGAAAALAAMTCPVNSMLQAVGRPYVPVRLLLCGAALKFLINWLLLSDPRVNIDGAAWGTLACYALIFLGGMFALLGETKLSFDWRGTLFCPLAGGGFCAAAAKRMLLFLGERLAFPAALLLSVAAGGVCYLLFLLILRPLSSKETEFLIHRPKIS